ncbi:glycosyl transferase [bacterium (Candidatus Gribaldobacteria) CG_4_10_14_0_2_um_filter_33_15]|uniref:Glycosyl transferase n=1 Tax=Candidatus Nealsonbacteria bacterium CG02_land_8_20_14_3_00_34_20 TaxID=1974698 RepID=A0A2M7DBI8_9BACT|nr:MAG: glycosyl transferase [Candidatus Nealsonbacteria bacterium CG02_land_8_20_14_3_00_34_20]PIW92531.1 MAG: glycosyl transferase [Candidatus Nealsonbacteria bacterium CG_4_8_14_3_um_filter_34_13]PJA00728.1 MAG: glycosyl transferase [bacterium (Candidatus Gribaldobacteria) CG_4_10_14_0_2_um_filter_33_15]
MKLSIIVPVFNEEESIEEIIKRIENVSIGIEKEIIVVNDGSYDETKDVLERLKRKFNFVSLEHQKNQGKGAAIRTGLLKARGDFILIQDADLEYDPKDYPILLEPLIKKEVKVVYGSRNLFENPRSSKSYFLGGQFLTFAFNLLFFEKLTDINTGYKVFAKEVLEKINLKENDFAFCEEITCKVKQLGYKIREVPIHYHPRSFKEGKKIRWYKDGLRGLWTIIKYRII